MRRDLIEKFTVLITGAFAFISALAWNSAVQQMFREIFPETKGLPAMFAYAIIITLIAVFATFWISKLSGKARG
jgi:uncharacterized membrane protein YidH (DUF202 family)